MRDEVEEIFAEGRRKGVAEGCGIHEEEGEEEVGSTPCTCVRTDPTMVVRHQQCMSPHDVTQTVHLTT